jgi:hypothetical protein
VTAYRIEVPGFDPVTMEAPNKRSVRYKAFRAMREAGYVKTFRQFLDLYPLIWRCGPVE